MTAERQEAIFNQADIDSNIGPNRINDLKVLPTPKTQVSEPTLPQGASVHVRRLKAAGKEAEAERFRQQALEAKQRQERLREVDELRINDLDEMLELHLTGIESADFTVEKMFLELKLQKRGWDDHRKVLGQYLDSLPDDVAAYLDGKIPDGKGGDTSRLLQIRNKIIPKEQLDKLMTRR